MKKIISLLALFISFWSVGQAKIETFDLRKDAYNFSTEIGIISFNLDQNQIPIFSFVQTFDKSLTTNKGHQKWGVMKFSNNKYDKLLLPYEYNGFTFPNDFFIDKSGKTMIFSDEWIFGYHVINNDNSLKSFLAYNKQADLDYLKKTYPTIDITQQKYYFDLTSGYFDGNSYNSLGTYNVVNNEDEKLSNATFNANDQQQVKSFFDVSKKKLTYIVGKQTPQWEPLKIKKSNVGTTWAIHDGSFNQTLAEYSDTEVKVYDLGANASAPKSLHIDSKNGAFVVIQQSQIIKYINNNTVTNIYEISKNGYFVGSFFQLDKNDILWYFNDETKNIEGINSVGKKFEFVTKNYISAAVIKMVKDETADIFWLLLKNDKLIKVAGVNTPTTLTPTFSYTPASPQTNQSINFKDESTGSPTTWAWDFGDGTTSNVQNPTKIYNKTGTYTVKLTVSKTGATAVFSTKEITVVAVSTNANILSVVAQSQNAIPTEGGTINLSVTSNIDWQLASNATWLKPSLTGGSGNGTVTLTAEKNTLTNDRTAKITFTGKNVASVEITVNQNKVGLTTATSAPFNLLAKTTTPTTIGLSWEQKGILPSTKFLIEQEQSNGSFKEIGRTTNSLPAYSIDALTPNNTYCFRVKTLLNQLESLPSNKACATTKVNNFKRGVTVVTHGFQLFGSGKSIIPDDGKVNTFVLGVKNEIGMCAAIKQRIEQEGGKATIYRNDIDKSKWILVDGDGKSTDEVILFYNWAIVSNDFADGALEASADNLFAMLARPKVEGKGEISDNLFELDLPFHFIAHSRGNIVLLQVLHRMLKYFPNKKVEHFTLLDPHPAKPMNDIDEDNQNNSLPGVYGSPKKYSQNEPFVILPTNVEKADVYYRQDILYEPLIPTVTNLEWANFGNFSGVDVKNASVKIPLLESVIKQGPSLPHSGVHEWYKGTIVNSDPFFENDGRFNWYKVLPRNIYGYNNSRVGNNIGKLANISNGISLKDMDERIKSRTGNELNPIFNGNFQYSNANRIYSYYFNEGEFSTYDYKNDNQVGFDWNFNNPPSYYIFKDKNNDIKLTHSNFYFPKEFKYLKVKIGKFLKGSFLNINFNSVNGDLVTATLKLDKENQNYYVEIPNIIIGDIGKYSLEGQRNLFKSYIQIFSTELVKVKPLNGGRQSAEQQIIVFPNPTTDKVTIDLSEIEDSIESIVLKDYEGNKIKEITIPIDGKVIQLDMKSYRMGIYFIQVQTNENIITKKIILNQE